MLLYMPTCKQLFQFQNVGTLDEHMHLLLPALIRLFKVDASVDIRRAAIKTLTKLIPRVQVVIRAPCFPLFFCLFVLKYFNSCCCIVIDIMLIMMGPDKKFFNVLFSFSGYWSHIVSCASLEACLRWVCFLFP